MAKQPVDRGSTFPARGNTPPARIVLIWLDRVRRVLSESRRRHIEDALRVAYGRPESRIQAIVVCDKLLGFSESDKPDVLSVELVTAERSFPRIVKVGPPAAIQRELDGWHSIQNRLAAPDPLFVSLTAPTYADQGDRVLEYDDANRVLSTSEVASLEDLVARCCSLGSPSVNSVVTRIRRIFDHMDRSLFRGVSAGSPDDTVKFYRRRLDEAFTIWRQLDRIRLRRSILLRYGSRNDSFQDPVDWMRWILSPHGRRCLPSCLFGPSHGDLHGRNVLIGLVHGEPVDEAVFDYEDAASDNPVAWDLVKLEMELKSHLLPALIKNSIPAHDDLDFVVDFERMIYQATLSLDWEALSPAVRPAVLSGKTYPESWWRLFEVVREIRRCARTCLSRRERFRWWKEEYLFTAVAYAVGTAKYRPYDWTQQRLAYVAGGVAAAHFASPERYCEQFCRIPVCRESPPAGNRRAVVLDVEGLRNEPRYPGFWTPLETLKQDAGSRNIRRVRRAVEQLAALHLAYPHVVQVEQEWALAMIEESTLTSDELRVEELRTRAGERLARLLREFPAADEETLGKLGRLHKECAWAINRLGRSPSADADAHYRRALSYYERAYKHRKHYYPGVNVATLQLLLGNEDEGIRVAREVLSGREVSRPEDSEDETERVWLEFTRGEACLILRQYSMAAECYRSAMSHHPPKAQADSPARHARCILSLHPPEDHKLERAIRHALSIDEEP